MECLQSYQWWNFDRVNKFVEANVRLLIATRVALKHQLRSVLNGRSAGRHDIQGIGPGFIPDVLRTDLIDQLITVTDQQAYETGRALAQHEGIMAGISTGAVVWAAVQLGQQRPNQRIVAIAASAGERYLSTAMWQTQEGR